MSWKDDKGIIIFLILICFFIIFCLIMTTRSSKKQKERITSGIETKEKQEQQQNTLINIIFEIVIGIIWLAMALLIFVLYSTNNMPNSIPIPRIFLFIYDFFGINVRSIIQIFKLF